MDINNSQNTTHLPASQFKECGVCGNDKPIAGFRNFHTQEERTELRARAFHDACTACFTRVIEESDPQVCPHCSRPIDTSIINELRQLQQVQTTNLLAQRGPVIGEMRPEPLHTFLLDIHAPQRTLRSDIGDAAQHPPEAGLQAETNQTTADILNEAWASIRGEETNTGNRPNSSNLPQ